MAKNFIQAAERSIKRRGTTGVCSGDKYGGPTCPPGSKRYNLATLFRRFAHARDMRIKSKTGT